MVLSLGVLFTSVLIGLTILLGGLGIGALGAGAIKNRQQQQAAVPPPPTAARAGFPTLLGIALGFWIWNQTRK